MEQEEKWILVSFGGRQEAPLAFSPHYCTSSRTSSILPAIALTVHRLSGMAIVGFLSSPLMVDPIHTLFAFVDCSHDPRHVCIFEK